MPVFNPNKTVSDSVLACNGLTTVTLSFEATPELSSKPADIVLIMDRSGSMAGNNLTAAKAAAKQLIETVAKASGSADGTAILNGSRLGLVSFADTATDDMGLTGDVAALNAAVDALSAGGSTNHKAAFEAAWNMLQPSASPRRILVMFTDGVTTTGGDPAPVAEGIKAAGMEIYCIGLTADPTPLNLWSSDPDSIYVALAADTSELDAAFAEIAAEVVEAGALDMVLQEVLNPDFKIVNVNVPTYGTVNVLNAHALEWKADAVGAAGSELASLSFDIMHIGNTGGIKSVNQSVVYSDRQGAALIFPDPKVRVNCGSHVIVEPCPPPMDFQMEGCQDAAVINANDTFISGLGRIVQVDALVKNVCPDKRTAVAVLLWEVDDQGVEYARGVKSVLIPALGGTSCQDVQLKCISFVVPEELDVSGDANSICDPRKFRVRVLANYVDTDFICCDVRTGNA